MRITFALGPFFPVPPVMGGGVERVQLALAEEFARRGHQVTILSRAYRDFPKEEMRAGVRHLRIDSWDAPGSKLLFRLYDLLYARRAAKVLPTSDVTITNSVFLPLILPRRRAGRLYVRAGRYPKGQMWLYLHVDRIHTLSAAIAEAIRRQTPLMNTKIVVIPNPLIGLLALPMQHDGLLARPRTILYVGRVAKEKGVHNLVEAFVRLRDGPLAGYQLRIVGPQEIREGGEGPDYMRRLKELAAPAGTAIAFDGLITDVQALRKIYEACDIFVYPSLAEKGETFGAAPLEAMAAGCRVVVSDLSCFLEYLEPGRNGVVFDHRNDTTGSLATALTTMVNMADPLPMREAAVATAGRFQLGPIADLFLADFARLVDAPRS